jgi:hypothetical protein
MRDRVVVLLIKNKVVVSSQIWYYATPVTPKTHASGIWNHGLFLFGAKMKRLGNLVCKIVACDRVGFKCQATYPVIQKKRES